jgi:hypothetical protein
MVKVNSGGRKCVIICPPIKGATRRILKQLKDTDFQWAYFGEDISKATAIEQQLRNKGQRIEIVEKLQETAWSLRQPYIDYIGKLGLENNSILWWTSSLSEKNPFISKVFLYCCYIKVCKNILNSKDKERCLLFFVENRALRRCLIQNLFTHHEYDIFRIESFSHTVFELFRDVFEIVVQKGGFLVNTIYHVLLAKYLYRMNPLSKGKLHKSENIFIHTWVDHRSFDTNNKYQESFFGDLAHRIINKGKNVIIIPTVLGRVSYRETLKRMIQSNENFLLPEVFLNITDILRAAMNAILNFPKKRVYPRFGDIEISKIIFNNCKRDWIETRIETVLLFYDVVKHWKNAGISIESFIYTYENHVEEKVFCLALRRFYPFTTIIGYQHSTVSKMLLNYFFSKDELPILPFPDKIITNGIYPERVFKESGYDSKKVVCGGAIRYSHFLGEVIKDSAIGFKKDNTSHVILVTPSAGRAEAAELFWKVLKAFEPLTKYKIVLKCHPLTPYHRIAKYLSVKSLPPHLIISDKPVSELLKESSILIYTDSTTCIEALSADIPALHISSGFFIDRDPLDFRPDAKMNACSPVDIVNCVRNTLELNEKTPSEKRKQWRQVSSEVFGTVDDSVYALFYRRY